MSDQLREELETTVARMLHYNCGGGHVDGAAAHDDDARVIVNVIWPAVVAYGDRRTAEARQQAEDCYTLLEQSLMITQNEPSGKLRHQHWMKVEAFLRGAMFARAGVGDEAP
jgi:hypothetical protein